MKKNDLSRREFLATVSAGSLAAAALSAMPAYAAIPGKAAIPAILGGGGSR